MRGPTSCPDLMSAPQVLLTTSWVMSASVRDVVPVPDSGALLVRIPFAALVRTCLAIDLRIARPHARVALTRPRMATFKTFLKSGHAPTLFAAFLYFDFTFAIWVLNGAMAPFIT